MVMRVYFSIFQYLNKVEDVLNFEYLFLQIKLFNKIQKPQTILSFLVRQSELLLYENINLTYSNNQVRSWGKTEFGVDG